MAVTGVEESEKVVRRVGVPGCGVRGGHFVAGVTGEQFADETATAHLRGRRAS